jgi:hypothetical protein
MRAWKDFKCRKMLGVEYNWQRNNDQGGNFNLVHVNIAKQFYCGKGLFVNPAEWK